MRDFDSLEKYSSAITLSDMEIFVFPELLYALVLANIMSPLLWAWREDPWFEKLDAMNEYRRVLRIKQFIMNRFVFNLDLDTWGLTDKEQEIRRFSPYIDPELLSRSNALFGYEGDKYYFDIDIRKHFGLDRYQSHIIPYWKTETLEAMEAFRYREGYPSGAGECVSLSTLYAAALFVIGRIDLGKIYLMATPLHSQNFIDVKKGILTNNRRIVTKNMWFNGTELSSKARRALENESISIIANHTGYIHTLYRDATIRQEDYHDLVQKLTRFLTTRVSFRILANFLRARSDLQECFQYRFEKYGTTKYVAAEEIYHYEHSAKVHFGTENTAKLLGEIDEYDLYPGPIPDRLVLNDLEEILADSRLPIDDPQTVELLMEKLKHDCYQVNRVIRELVDFCSTHPRFPQGERRFVPSSPVDLRVDQTREDMISCLEGIRDQNTTADLAFYAYRDIPRSDWRPFLKAALERNPVILRATADLDIPDCYRVLSDLADRSIYDGNRLAQPDEVWNFKRGDGLEKSIGLAAILRNRRPGTGLAWSRNGREITLRTEANETFRFPSDKSLSPPGPKDLP